MKNEFLKDVFLDSCHQVRIPVEVMNVDHAVQEWKLMNLMVNRY